ncbi:MAG: thioredoxin family protein [Parachlamydia sp.]|nr:thioredoxin family protein [Parachlamydia sp.]
MKRKKTNIRLLLLLFPFFLSFCLFFSNSTLSANEDPLRIALISEEETVQPGRPFWMALRLQIDDHWHAYWKNPGDSGMPTAVEWELPPGVTAGAIQWPYPQRFDLDSLIGYGYEGETWLLVEMTPSAAITREMTIKAHVRSLVCSDSACLPIESDLALQIPVAKEAPVPRKEWTVAFEQARAKLPKNNWSVKAERSGALIQLTLDAPAGLDISQALFFPDSPQGLDATAEPFLSRRQSGRYIVALKGEEGAHPEQLKGVLLVTHAGGKEAIAVDASYAGDKLVALGDEQPNKELHLAATSETEGFGIVLLLAFIGGMILNLMPCVLPVVSFKILSFVKMAGQCRAKTLQHGMAFSAGVIVSFWVLAGLLLLLQAYGHSVGWGFQLQEPLFIALLAALLLVFGLSLFGIFEIGTGLMGMASDAQQRSSGLVGSFMSGVLATTVATPCTGPFLGTAVGFAVSLPAIFALAIFTAIGFGMAAPYLALTAYPSLLRFLPKPGAWMITFKELMGFLMFGTVLWLTWVFGAQTNSLGLFMLLGSFFFISIACWIYGKWGGALTKTKTVRRIGMLGALLCMAVAGYAIIEASRIQDVSHQAVAASEGWEPFSAERVVELQKQGVPVFVDFTAKWCLICQANHLVLSVNDVEAAFNQKGVVKMKADWTKADPAITMALKQYGRNSVPLYLLYGTDSSQAPQILPQVLTPEIVLRELQVLEQTALR